MARLRSTVVLIPLVLGVACQDGTIELETDPAASTNEGTAGSGSSTSSSSTSASTTDPVTRPNPPTTSTTTEGDDESTTGPRESQTLLLAIETSLAPGLPLQAIVETQPGPGTIDLRLQWLSLDVGSTTEPREPVGEPLEYVGLTVADDGSFSWPTGEIEIPGEANPITGSDILIDVVAEVAPAGDPYCGIVMGSVLSPIQAPLDGSTHAMTEIESLDALPVEIVVACS